MMSLTNRFATVKSGFNKAIILSFACIHLLSIMCVYDMLNEPCKKHKAWGNCHVSVLGIAMEKDVIQYSTGP